LALSAARYSLLRLEEGKLIWAVARKAQLISINEIATLRKLASKEDPSSRDSCSTRMLCAWLLLMSFLSLLPSQSTIHLPTIQPTTSTNTLTTTDVHNLHVKNFRPQLLILCKLNDDLMPKYRKMFAFVSQMKAGKGLTVCMSVIPGDYVKRHQAAVTAKANLRKYMNDERVKGFVDVLVTKNVADGLSHM